MFFKKNLNSKKKKDYLYPVRTQKAMKSIITWYDGKYNDSRVSCAFIDYGNGSHDVKIAYDNMSFTSPRSQEEKQELLSLMKRIR